MSDVGERMPPSPTVRRRRLAAELRRIREAAGLTIDEAAAAADISKSALSRIENALVSAKPPVVRALAHAYSIPPKVSDQLLNLARDAGQVGWWNTFSDVLEQGASVYIGFEAEAASIRTYEVLPIPGLLQTRKYAESLFRTLRLGDDDITRKVEARMKRQDRLQEIDLWFILEEGTLRRPVGGADVMREQLEHILNITELRNITLQVLPEAVGAHAGFDGSFCLFEFPDDSDPAIGYAETQAGQIWVEKAEDVKRLGRNFDQLRAAAMGAEDSRSYIRKLLGAI